jgi:aryl-alcohol dehydrogenase-like predicted oxidoreductase
LWGHRCKIHHITAVQIEYNPFSLDIEQNGLLAACRELGVAVVCYAPLGRGFLTGQLKSSNDFPEGDIRRFLPRFSPENFPKNLKIVEALEAMAKSKDVNVSTLALAWLLAQGDDIVPIPGTTKPRNLDTNILALSVTLTTEENKKIRDVVEVAGVSGGRYHAA